MVWKRFQVAQHESQQGKRPRVVSNQLEVYHQCYDATLALAHALDETIRGNML